MGTGFGTRGGVNTRGCPQKNFPAAFGGRKIFSPAPPPGGEKFFPVGCLFSRPGGDFAKKMEKMASPGGQKNFSPGCFAPGGAPPLYFFTPGVRQFLLVMHGCTPPHSALSQYWRVMESPNNVLLWGFCLFSDQWALGECQIIIKMYAQSK